TVVAAVLGAGVTMSNAYLVGGRRYSIQAITEASMSLALIIGFIGWGVWIAAGSIVHARFFSSLSETAVLLVGISIPVQMVRNYLTSVQQGLQTFTEANVVLLVEDVATLLFVLPLIWGVESGPTVIVFASVGGSVVSCIASVWYLVRHGYTPWPRLHRELSLEMMRFGLKGHIGRIANMLNWRLDVMILSVLAPVEVVGYYAVATKVAEAFRPLSAAFTFVLRPMIASLSVSEARAQGVSLYRRVFALNLLLVVIMAFAGGPIIVRMFGPDFVAAVPAFQILRNPLPSGPDPLACPVCRGPLSVRAASVRCTACALRYPRRDGVYLLGPPFAVNVAGRTFATDRMRRLAADAHAAGWDVARQ